jgi:hypothetical protein
MQMAHVLVEFKGERFWFLRDADGAGLLVRDSENRFTTIYAYVGRAGTIQRYGTHIGDRDDLHEIRAVESE